MKQDEFFKELETKGWSMSIELIKNKECLK